MPYPDILVVGGGIIGLACARELARAGFKVEVLERLPAGAEASLAAAGMLAPMAEAAALAATPALSALSAASAISATSAISAISATPATPATPSITEAGRARLLAACRAARDLWLSWAPALSAETGLSLEHDTSGTLLVALDDKEETWLDRVAVAARQAGELVEEIEGAVLARWVPDVSPGVRRSLLLPGEHRVDNVQACTLLALAARHAGAVLSYGVEVARVERAGLGVRVLSRGREWQAGLLVLAAGAWSGNIPGLPPLPVRPVRGQMLQLGGVDWPWNGSLRGAHSYAVRRGASRLLVGATVEEAGFAAHNTPAGIESLLRFIRHALPGLEKARLENTWAGLRPGTPDGLPIIGSLPGWPVLSATGHYRNGILLAPWTAREIARLAASASSEVPEEAGPFAPARFMPPQAANPLSPRCGWV